MIGISLFYQIMIGRNWRVRSSGVAHPSPDDPLGAAEEGLRKPESAHPERGLLGGHLRLEQGHRGAA
jgi:hypothetical protein